MHKALITGARGFCATHLAQRLRGEAVRIAGLSRGPGGDERTFDEWHAVDPRDRDALTRTVASVRPDWVFHLAGAVTGAPADVHQANTLMTVQLLDALREHAAGARVVLVGSAAEYGPDVPMPVAETARCNPRGAYGISKYAATLSGLDFARRFGLHVVVARPFSIVGAGMPASLVLGAVLERAARALQKPGAPVVRVGNVDTARDFIAVQDLVEGYVRLIRYAAPGEVFNLCSGEPTRIRDVVERMLANAPRPIRLEADPALVRADDPPAFYGSPDKARDAIGFAPRVPIDQSLREAWVHAMRGAHVAA
jgi:GDP-4-dehydro-6-deoxy-D-mannose reductase